MTNFDFYDVDFMITGTSSFDSIIKKGLMSVQTFTDDATLHFYCHDLFSHLFYSQKVEKSKVRKSRAANVLKPEQFKAVNSYTILKQREMND